MTRGQLQHPTPFCVAGLATRVGVCGFSEQEVGCRCTCELANVEFPELVLVVGLSDAQGALAGA